MSDKKYAPRDWTQQPPYLYPEYKSTTLRSPSKPLVALPETLSELTGPVYGAEVVDDLDDDLTNRIKAKIRTGASPRHLPAKVLQVNDIPRTVNGKITELAVTEVIHGRAVKNREALANPEALELYRDLPALAE